METNAIYTEIRKLRKKLRQIENLEKAQRPLNSDEQAKIKTKHSLRSALQEKLKIYEESDIQESQPPTYSSQDQDQEQEVTGFVESRAHEPEEYHAPGSSGESELIPEELPAKSSPISQIETSSEDRTEETQVPGSQELQKQSGKESKKSQPVHRGAGDHKAEEARPNKVPEKKIPSGGGGDARSEINPWDKVKFTVTELVGHNDIICSVDCCGDTIISGSRDTSIKIWDACSGSELRSLGGHTDSVTAVLLVPVEDCEKLASAYSQSDDARFIISTSLDCSVKVWSLESGEQLNSIYTFNPVTCLGYVKGRHLAVTAYTGGKVELWDILTGQSVYSVIGHNEVVTSVKVSGERIVTASGDGIIKLWVLRETSLHPIFVSEDVRPALPRMKVITRKVHTALEKNNRIYYGDDGHNVKVLDWREGLVHKLRNHKDGNDFGLVDSILVTSDSNYLVCSGYDIDLGNGYLNLFLLEGEKYLATLTDDSIGRVFTLADCIASEGHVRLVTGGAELKVWDVSKSKSSKRGKTVTAFYNQEFSRKARDSEEESDDESSDDEDNIERSWSHDENDDDKQDSSSSWWCVLI